MNTKYFFIFALLGLWSLASGCGEATDSPATSKTEIVGTYKGRYAEGIEIFEIHGDGTFLQTFRGGTNSGYTSTGKWIYETNMVWKGESNKISRISFEPFMIPSGLSACVTDTKVETGAGEWRRNPVRFELGPWPYFVRKDQTNEGAVK
jgi:hypothetical protein